MGMRQTKICSPPWEKQASIENLNWPFMGVRLSGLETLFRAHSSLCWLFMEMLEKTKIHTQPPIFTFSYFSHSFLVLQFSSHSSICIMSIYIEFDILQTLSFPSSHCSLTWLQEEGILQIKEMDLKEVDTITLAAVRVGDKTFVFSFHIQGSSHLHSSLPSQRGKRWRCVLACQLPYWRARCQKNM